MNILLLAGIVPFRTHGEPGVTAAHIVTRALIDQLGALGHKVTLQCILHQARPAGELKDAERRELEDAKTKGIGVLPPLFLSEHFRRKPERLRSLRMIGNTKKALAHFYPGFCLRSIMQDRLRAGDYDVVVPVWSPQGVAATHGLDVPRVAFHGDIDFEPSLCRLVLDPALFQNELSLLNPVSVMAYLDRQLRVRMFRKAHMALMAKVDALANITARNAEFYDQHGHPKSVYTRNIWVDGGAPAVRERKEGPINIIGHVGYLDKTGGTYGLRFLLEGVVPALEKTMAGKDYEVQIIGGGEMMPALRPLAKHPRIRLRGFVEDLEAELAQSDVFCLFNNVAPYKAAYTRHLVAWSNGLCMVAHADSKLAIPELEHRRNVLLADNAEDAARSIAEAAMNAELNRQIRLEGRKTYEECFTPEIVAKRLEEVLQSVGR